MKAIFELVVAARASAPERRGVRLVALGLQTLEHDQATAPPTPRCAGGPSRRNARLLDQRLDKRLDLVAVDGIARARRARWGGDAHGFVAGDQTSPLSCRPGVRVRFRCWLPSAFMT